MTTFAVLYSYNPASEKIASIRPDHRTFLRDLKDQGILIGSGPFTDTSGGALIVIRVEEEDAPISAAEKIMDNDPFWLEHAIDSRSIHPWNPVLNIWD